MAATKPVVRATQANGRDLAGWMNQDKGSDGLTNNQRIARNLGYTGMHGNGDHERWLNAVPGRMEVYQAAIHQGYAAAQTDDPTDDDQVVGSDQWLNQNFNPGFPGITRGMNQQIARATGYTGSFATPEHGAWLNADPARMSSYQGAIATATKLVNGGSLFGTTVADPITAKPTVDKPEQASNPLVGTLLEMQQADMRASERRRRMGRSSLFGASSGFGSVGMMRGTLGGN
ncbi:hypothetical protein [Azospirillum sp. sgz301742]